MRLGPRRDAAAREPLASPLPPGRYTRGLARRSARDLRAAHGESAQYDRCDARAGSSRSGSERCLGRECERSHSCPG
eukprot:4670552-Alexandrium_andersonii.AAC.1